MNRHQLQDAERQKERAPRGHQPNGMECGAAFHSHVYYIHPALCTKIHPYMIRCDMVWRMALASSRHGRVCVCVYGLTWHIHYILVFPTKTKLTKRNAKEIYITQILRQDTVSEFCAAILPLSISSLCAHVFHLRFFGYRCHRTCVRVCFLHVLIYSAI